MSGASADPGLDVGELFAALASHRVEYLVIGGVATQVHGHRRTTMDLDVTPEPSSENLQRLGAALADLDARLRDLEAGEVEIPVSDPERLAVAAIVPPLMTRHGQIHILKEPKGARGYEEMRGRALVAEVDGVEVAIVSLDDLVRMKRAAGRPSDIEDIAVLAKVARQDQADPLGEGARPPGARDQ